MFPEYCHLVHCGLVGDGVTPITPCRRITVTDGDPVPDRDAGTSHGHASAANRYASAANADTSAANEHASAPA